MLCVVVLLLQTLKKEKFSGIELLLIVELGLRMAYGTEIFFTSLRLSV